MSKHKMKHLLDELRSELQKLARGPSKKTELVVERATDPVEEAQARMIVDIAVSGLNFDWETAKAIEEAIDKVRAGEYGLCQACGGEIHAKRLQAIPWARFCVRCQAELEGLKAESEPYGKVA